MSNTITNIKRFIGTKFSESGVQAELAHCNFSAVEGPGGETSVEVSIFLNEKNIHLTIIMKHTYPPLLPSSVYPLHTGHLLW